MGDVGLRWFGLELRSDRGFNGKSWSWRWSRQAEGKEEDPRDKSKTVSHRTRRWLMKKGKDNKEEEIK